MALNEKCIDDVDITVYMCTCKMWGLLDVVILQHF